MNAKKCDRCGKFFDPDLGDRSDYLIIDFSDGAGCYLDEYDLCRECTEKLRRFMEMKEDE